MPVQQLLAIAVRSWLAIAPVQDHAAAEAPVPQFFQAAASAGLSFVHEAGGSGRYYVWESVGPGITVTDYDNDGRIDVYAVQGGSPTDVDRAGGPVNRLFRNVGSRFEAPDERGAYSRRPITVGGDGGYGMGAAAGDYDADGSPDLYLTNWGTNVLLRNNGDGTFEEVTGRAGVGDERWSTAAMWADLDGDGDLDLYVTNYLDATVDNHRTCRYGTDAVVSYCGPALFEGAADELFRNEGDGTFTAIGELAGIANAADGKGMAADIIDDDDDGDLDVYVANDTRGNFLYRNDGAARFVEDGLVAGPGMSGDGRPQAGMGVVWEDLDGDRDPDLVVTNFQDDYNTLYRREGPLYIDDSAAAGLRGPSLPYVAFGIVGFDADLDGDIDLFVANGHIYTVREHYDSRLAYAQPNLLLLNDGNGVFEDVTGRSGPGLGSRAVSRGAAAADLDDDGDSDLLIANNGDALELLANGTWGAAGGDDARRSIRVRLVGRGGSREGLGAVVTCFVDGRPIVLRTHPGGSFMSQGDPRVICGLDGADAADVEVLWPGGERDLVTGVPAGQTLVVTEGRGVTARGPAPAPAATPVGLERALVSTARSR